MTHTTRRVLCAAVAASVLSKAAAGEMTQVMVPGAGTLLFQPNADAAQSVSELREKLIGASKMSDVPGFAALKAGTFQQSGSQLTGLTAYDLEAPARLIYPLLTPLRNIIPRVSGKGGIQANWKSITAVNVQNLDAGVSEGNRGPVTNVTISEYNAAYRGIGFESNATFEAQYAADTFDDVRARAATTGLHSLMLAEEQMLLQGNGSLALGVGGTPSLSSTTGSGALATQTLSVIVVPLTARGFYRHVAATVLSQYYTRTNADGSQDVINGGTGQKSAAATVAVTGPQGAVLATTTASRGAAAYAWFWGPSGSEAFGGITTSPRLAITGTAANTQLASAVTATDNSVSSLSFDGLITQALKPGSGSYWADLGGATLTADGDGGIVEIDALLKDRWDNFRLNPDIIWVSSQQAKDITDKVLSGKTNSLLRLNVDMRQGMLAGGTLVTSYLNKYGLGGATEVLIRQHPNLTPGTILAICNNIPYALPDVINNIQVRTRQEYYQIEWPLRTRRYEYGVYADEVLQIYFPPCLGILSGIGAG